MYVFNKDFINDKKELDKMLKVIDLSINNKNND